MKIKQKEFDQLLETTGSLALNLSKRSAICNELARWFFIRQEPESQTTQLVREYLLELDNVGYVEWEKD